MRTAWRWLLYCILAVPAICLPYENFMGPGRVHFNLGWPVPWADLEVLDGPYLRLQPVPTLLPVAAAWIWIAWVGSRVRTWAVRRPDWRGALLQAILTSFYLVLLFCFIYGVVSVIWTWRLERPLGWPAFENTMRFGRYWLPYLYAVAVLAILVALHLDVHARSGRLRLFHAAFAVCFLAFLFPYIRWQMREFDSSIQFAQKQQK